MEVISSATYDGRVRLLDLVMASAAVAGVSGRRDKTARPADLLARFDPDDGGMAIA